MRSANIRLKADSALYEKFLETVRKDQEFSFVTFYASYCKGKGSYGGERIYIHFNVDIELHYIATNPTIDNMLNFLTGEVKKILLYNLDLLCVKIIC